jgi:hypothetical protein
MLRSPGIRFRPGNRRTCSWSHDRDAASIHAPHGSDGSEAPMHPLTHQLQGLEATSRPRCMNADDFRVGVFHGDEDIGPASPMVIVCVMSVRHISLTLSVMIVPSAWPRCVQRDVARASRSDASPVAHGGGSREREQSAIAPITCGSPRREGGVFVYTEQNELVFWWSLSGSTRLHC